MRFEVFIRNERGQTRTVCVDSKEELKNMTVEELRRRSFPKENTVQILIYNGRQLEDDQTLGSYNIITGSTIYACLHLRGGGEEEFKSSTEETERKLVPEDEEEIKLIPEDEERKLVSEDEEEIKLIPEDEEERKLIPKDEEVSKNSTAEETERKLVPEDKDGDKSYESEIAPPWQKDHLGCFSSTVRPHTFRCGRKRKFESLSSDDIISIYPHLGYKDDDEEKEISRTQSMENLTLMNKNPLQQ
ncbi:polyubiquitin-like isoform X2 [Carassius auratus]|uniref:Polyubiquitin-like isoform X2 n=1 Tax=Carassius auratus TaxID=7957 RepID=A0A6P6JFH1_CARAU|nr:polyubiquitin-like isoform X2 [Carassius auratus]